MAKPVVPIRPDAEKVFERNAPIINDQMQESIDCMRYEMGLCRECDAVRGYQTPWCRGHYPWDEANWVER